jgi:class I fructose-bisphosphate aldolase
MAATVDTPTTADRPATLEEMNLTTGKRTRLRRLLYDYGTRNGRAMFLPYDQGLEHGPRDFFANPDAADPRYIFRLAKAGRFNGVAVQIGVAQRYYADFAGEIPLIVKLNGKTDLPPDAQALSPLNATVEEAVALGADAVGYTLYVGSPAQPQDFAQMQAVRRECDRYGMPLIVWSYPRGEAVSEKGGKDSVYAIDYAARVAHELGADVIKINVPKAGPSKGGQKPYDSLDEPLEESIRRVVRSCGTSLVLISGGEKTSDEGLIEKARVPLEAGATGLIFGRNLWQRSWDDALAMCDRLRDLLTAVGGPA